MLYTVLKCVILGQKMIIYTNVIKHRCLVETHGNYHQVVKATNKTYPGLFNCQVVTNLQNQINVHTNLDKLTLNPLYNRTDLCTYEIKIRFKVNYFIPCCFQTPWEERLELKVLQLFTLDLIDQPISFPFSLFCSGAKFLSISFGFNLWLCREIWTVVSTCGVVTHLHTPQPHDNNTRLKPTLQILNDSLQFRLSLGLLLIINKQKNTFFFTHFNKEIVW